MQARMNIRQLSVKRVKTVTINNDEVMLHQNGLFSHGICSCVNLQKTLILHRQQIRRSSYYTFPLFTGTQYALETIHAYSALPWWATIACTTVVLRVAVTLPLAIKQNQMISKMEMLKPMLKEVTDAVRYNTIARGQKAGKGKQQVQLELMKEIRKYTKDFYQRNGVNTMALFLLPWIQLPLWVTVSFALRNISGFVPRCDDGIAQVYHPSPGAETEGLLWFSNLTVPDPFYIIPVVLLVTNLLNIELNSMKNQTPSTASRVLTNIFRGLTCLVFLVSTQVPSALSLYWACSSTYGLTQNIAMKFPRVRRKLSIPKTPSEQEKPFKAMAEILRIRAKRFLELQKE